MNRSYRTRPVHDTRRAFTLIELLVVIAIIAILAAILFPVFAQARAKARQTSCASNMKQLSLGMIQYQQDYDGVVPPYRTRVSYVFNGLWYGAYANGSPLTGTYWSANLQPYTKSWDISHCADAFDGGVFGPAADTNAGLKQVSPDYGLNAENLYNTYDSKGCHSFTPGYGDPAVAAVAEPRSDAEIVSPARCVMLSDMKVEAKATGGGAVSYFGLLGGYATAPGMGPSDDSCAPYNNVTWGTDSYWETAAYGGNINKTGTGSFMPRHNNGGNLSFMDGHVKWYSPGGAAAGTNWTPTSTMGSITTISYPSYIWSATH